MTTEPTESPLTRADAGSVSLRVNRPIDLTCACSMFRVALQKLVDAPMSTLAIRVDASMITLEGPATIEAADQRLIIAREMASDDTDAIIRRHPEAPIDPPTPLHLRIAFIKRNFRAQHWQSQYVQSFDEQAVLSLRLTSPDHPVWKATDEELAIALQVPLKSLSIERWTVAQSRALPAP